MDEAIIDRLYEAAVVPESWTPFLAELARCCGATDALCSRLMGERVSIISINAGFKDTWEFILLNYGGVENERTRRAVALQHAGFITDEDVFLPGEAERLPMYRDVLIPRGYGSGVATAIAVPSGDIAMINLERPFAEGPFPRRVVAALDGLRPHFARAAFLSHRLETERAAGAVTALETMGLPAAVLGRGGRAIAANPSLVDLMPDVVQDRPARLALAHAPADRLLSDAIAALAHAPHDACVRSIPIPARDERPPVIVHLAPIRGAAHDIFSQAIAILAATPVVPRDVPTATVVQGLFDLTASEAKLAALIAAGHQPREAAVRLGCTYETARTTLKRVMAKTGVSRQAELVGLLSLVPRT